MKRKYSLQAAILFVLCMLLLSACTAGAPAAEPAVPEAVPSKSVAQAPPIEEPKASAEAAPQEQPAAASEPSPSPDAESSEAAAQAKPETPPAKEADNTSIQVEGSGLNKPISLSLDDLEAMKEYIVEDDFFSLNSYGTKEYFHFKGVRLAAVLHKAGLKKEEAVVTVIASDGYKLEFSLEQALKEDYIDEQDPSKKYPVIIAWQENGSDYDAAAGYPFRLVIGQKEAGDVNKPQWVMNIAKITVN